MHPYECWLTRRYLANILKGRRLATAPRYDADIVEWVENYGPSLGVPVLKLPPEPRRNGKLLPSAERSAGWRVWRMAAVEAGQGGSPSLSKLQRRIGWLAKACALTSLQSDMIGLLARSIEPGPVSALVGALRERMAIEFDAPRLNDLRALLSPRFEVEETEDEEQLFRLGLVQSRDEPRLSAVVRRILAMKTVDGRSVGEFLLGPPAKASLNWEDFGHLGASRDIASRLIAAFDGGERARRDAGLNILLYGPSGTGKTEFAKTLGAHLGFAVQFIGETNERRLEPARHERIAALIIANAIGAVARKTIVVVDEADDLFGGVDEEDRERRRGSKVFLNRLLERTAAPTIWIANDPDRLGEPVVRRMNLAIRFPRPALSVRKAMIAQIADKTGFSLSGLAIAKIARYRAPPALIENAVRSAAMLAGGAEEATLLLEQGLEALGQKPRHSAGAQHAFDPALSAADTDLVLLADRVAGSNAHALSFFFSGPSGAGKSAYARYLAERLDMEVVERRFSDLTSSFLGETEKTIAAAFEEAADLRAFLLIDEADSLLRDRRGARHSWEVSIVNETLTQMERHPAPIACTTNAPDAIDRAAARRFLFNVRFLPMTKQQVTLAYARAFRSNAPIELSEIEGLAPGDFFNVGRRAELMSVSEPATLIGWLREEVVARVGTPRQKIGF
jgi:transitional endoplasmic reticulum ATPase